MISDETMISRQIVNHEATNTDEPLLKLGLFNCWAFFDSSGQQSGHDSSRERLCRAEYVDLI